MRCPPHQRYEMSPMWDGFLTTRLRIPPSSLRDSGGIRRLVVRKIHLTWKTIQNAYPIRGMRCPPPEGWDVPHQRDEMSPFQRDEMSPIRGMRCPPSEGWDVPHQRDEMSPIRGMRCPPPEGQFLVKSQTCQNKVYLDRRPLKRGLNIVCPCHLSGDYQPSNDWRPSRGVLIN